MVSASDVTDGLSCTYMLGEKYLDPEHYNDGVDEDEDGPFCVGHDRTTYRQGDPPMRDRRGVGDCGFFFGSAHDAGFNMVMADGSVHTMSFQIDPTVHFNLCGRNNGQPREISQF